MDPDALMALLGAFMVVLLFIGLVFLIAHLISKTALVDAVNKLTRGGEYCFGTSFSAGIDFFWRMVGLFILEFIAVVGVVIVVVILVLTIIGILVAIPAAIFAAYALFTLFELATRVIVARDCSIGDGLSEAYHLMKERFSDTLVMALIFLGLVIATGIATMIIWLMFGIPIGAVVWGATESVGAAIILGILVGLPISLVLGGFLGTFFSSMYTLFYFELVEPQPVEVGASRGPQPPPSIHGGGPHPGGPMPPPGGSGPTSGVTPPGTVISGTPGEPNAGTPSQPPEPKPPERPDNEPERPEDGMGI
jgi:hypothetical protein